MLHNRAMQLSLAASAAVVCMLGLAPSASAWGGGFSSPRPDRPGCCAGSVDATGGAIGAESPGAGAAPAAGPLAHDTAPPDLGARRREDPALAQAAEEQPAEPAEEEPPAGEGSGEGSGEPERTPDPPPAPDDAFEGSTKPAGPDLTVNEERELISRGWD